MARRILLACLACFWFQFIFSQSMSDDQVVRYVMEQQEKGKDQQYIVSQLLQKGVTVDQLRRIRKKYEAEQNQPGALDLTGTTQAKSGTSRLRTNKEKTRDERQKQNGYMIRSQREIKDGEDKTLKNQQLNEEIGFMDIDSLIYYRNYFKEDDRQVFGRNIFNNEMLTFEPSMNIPTPANYRLGAGDAVIIDVWGASQTTFEGTVSPDGTVTIEGVGPLTLAGMTVKEANDYVKKQLGRFYSNSNITLTVGETRSIQVQVMGEVMVPGTYTLSALSSAFNALYAAGGISEIGTLRDIKVFRQGRVVSTIDVYDYILNGNTKGDIRLADNDVIVVGPYECLVNIRGKVKRPMFYEMKEDESVSRILDYAGGFAGDAYTDNVRLIRKSGREYSVYTVGEFEMNGFLLKDGDSLYVDSIIPRFSNMAEIRGAVFHPGQYQMDGSIKTVRQLIKAADGLREDAFLKRAVMHRQKEDLTMEALSVDVEGIMDGVASSPEKLDKYIRTIYNKANDMDRLIDELTFYSKIDTNKIPYTFSKINVSQYFRDCVEEVGLDMEARGIELGYFNYVDEDVVVIADAEQMKRVINNIISNSVKYLDKKKGIINIRIKDDGDFIQVEIEDNGKGIAAKDLPNIFDRFYRTDSSRNSSQGGSGIGLSIVRKIIEDHGGRIWATSKEGIGTEVHFVLRKYQEVVQE